MIPKTSAEAILLSIAVLILGAALAFACGVAEARSQIQVRKFQRIYACPSTRVKAPPCPGWVVDHIMPLCAGGADSPENMQWQERVESLEKDRIEADFCRWLRKSSRKRTD